MEESTEEEDDLTKGNMFDKLNIFDPKIIVDEPQDIEQPKEIEKPEDIEQLQVDEEVSPVPLHYNKLTLTVLHLQESVAAFTQKYARAIKIFKLSSLLTMFLAHFSYATYYFFTNKYPAWEWEKGYGLYLSLVIIFVVFVLIKYVFKPAVIACLVNHHGQHYEDIIKIRMLNFQIYVQKHKSLPWITYIILLATMLTFLSVDSWQDPERLIAIIGYFVILITALLLSNNIGLVKPRTVFCGMFLHFCMALVTVKIGIGREIFRVIGDRITLFLDYTEVGARFVFGDLLTYDAFTFAFRGLSTVYFLASIVGFLYYYNILQRIVFFLGTFLSYILDTTIVESVNAAANICFGITESPLLLRPYLVYLTPSEVHAVVAAGFASVAGTVMGLYISFGARADHMIIASVINPFATLYFSKILFPEDEVSQTTKANIKMPESDSLNALDAITTGAMHSVQLVLGIVSNIMAFLTIMVIVNDFMEWIGDRVDVDDFSLEVILSYVFMPLSFLFGVKWSECYHVGSLIATKSIINELVAYQKLGKLKAAGVLSKRSVAIATFAIFGFANPGTIGIIISAFYFLEPLQVHNVIRSIFRSFACGTMTCFSTACLVGMLLKDEDISDM